MINSLFKITLFAAIFRWLKPRYKAILVSVALILVVNLAHSEYIQYVTITSRFDYLEISYLVKFLFWITILVAYYFLAEVRIIVGKEQSGTNHKMSVTRDKPDTPEFDAGSTDGFDFLRDKDKLESKVEKVIAGKAVGEVGLNSGSGDKTG